MENTIMQKVMILGSTGSVGSSTLDLIGEAQADGEFQVETLIAGSNAVKLAAQAIRYCPKRVVIYDETQYLKLKDLLSSTDVKVATGQSALLDAVSESHDITIAAISGIAGLLPIYRCIPHTKKLAIANKESIVCSGQIIKNIAKNHNTQIIPIDSEHSAIFQILNSSIAFSLYDDRRSEESKCSRTYMSDERHSISLNGKRYIANSEEYIEKITLTASGGPFLNTSDEKMEHVKPADAIKHPNWSMGAKISVDSATLMNKGLEVIEAAFLFDLPAEKIDVLIHPESIIHGLVHYIDGSTIAQMSIPDMKTSISLALKYPQRFKWQSKTLDLSSIGRLNFAPVNHQKFPLLEVAYSALKDGIASCIILNAANEVAVNAFLKGNLKFLDIANFVRTALEKTARPRNISSIEDVIELDRSVRGKQ